MRKFIDVELDKIVTENDIREEYEYFRQKDSKEYNYSFERYLDNCLSKNGSLEEIKTLCVCDRCLCAIESHEGRQRYDTYDVGDGTLVQCDWCEEDIYGEAFVLR